MVSLHNLLVRLHMYNFKATYVTIASIKLPENKVSNQLLCQKMINIKMPDVKDKKSLERFINKKKCNCQYLWLEKGIRM